MSFHLQQQAECNQRLGEFPVVAKAALAVALTPDTSDDQLIQIIEQELVRAESVLATLCLTAQEIAEQHNCVTRCQQMLMDLDYVRRNGHSQSKDTDHR